MVPGGRFGGNCGERTTLKRYQHNFERVETYDEDRITIRALSSSRDEGWIRLDYGTDVIHDYTMGREARLISSWIAYTFNGE